MARALTIIRKLSTITKQITASASRGYTTKTPFELPPGWIEARNEWKPNASMIRGPKNFIEVWKTDQGVFGWTLMPGVSEENVSIKVRGNDIIYSGTEDRYFPGLPADVVRSYEGTIFLQIDPNKIDASRVKFELVNGVLWIHVPTKAGPRIEAYNFNK